MTGATGLPSAEGADAVNGTISVSALEFDVLWEHLRLPSMPVVIKVGSPGGTFTERRRLVAEAWAGLERRGFGRPVGVHPLLEHLLRLLAQPDREVDGRFWGAGAVAGETRVLAAARGGDGALAVLRAGTLTVRQTSPAGLPSAALGVLNAIGPAGAGPGHSVTMPTHDFESAAATAGADRSRFREALDRRGVRADDIDALLEMIGDVSGYGKFGAAARDKLGRRHRAPRVISFFDTTAGRYLQVRRTSIDGRPWTTLSPADHRRIGQHVDELYRETVERAGAGVD